MPGESDRDRKVDQLLKTTMRGAESPASSACVDAETLGAWSARALSAAEAAQVELHLSSCARCQATMALFARIEPAAPTPVPVWRRSWLGWLVPLTAAAAAVVIWIALPTHEPSEVSNPTMARVEPSPAVAGGPPPAAVPERRSTPPVAPPDSQRKAQAKAEVSASPPPTPSPVPVPPSARPMPAPVRVAAPPTAQTQPPPPPVSIPPPTPVAQSATPPPPTPATAMARDVGRPVGAASQTRGMAQSVIDITSVIEIVAPDPTADQTVAAGRGGGRGGGGGGGRAGGAARTVAVPPGPPTRWRILAATKVERSTDGGASWEPIAIDPPVRLTGGVAPSASVCWLIGRGGVILLATDGLHFERVKFPESTDLLSIRATGARQASVTTPDGRVFTTTDGGVTWRLQGFSAPSF